MGSVKKSHKVMGELYALRHISTGLYMEHDGTLTHELNHADLLATVQNLKKKFSALYNKGGKLMKLANGMSETDLARCFEIVTVVLV